MLEGLEAKMLEVRDRATFIPVLAIEMDSFHAQTRYLLRRAGWNNVEVIIVRPTGNLSVTCQPTDWQQHSTGRTLGVAHQYIIDHWEELKSGDVVDVEYVLGEVDVPKRSEFYDI